MTLRLCDTQWPNSGLFLQNALVEYIGVYSDTNEGYNRITTHQTTCTCLHVLAGNLVPLPAGKLSA